MKKDIEKNKKLVLLDAHAIIHRAYHALPDFSSTKGEPTGALYGLVSMLIKIINDLSPDYLIACYDVPEPTHRHEVYKEYKAGRKKIDDELILQLERSKDIFKALNIPIYSKAGFEADDVIGTIVSLLKNDSNTDIVIASGDMDTLQLVSGKKVQVYTLKKGIKDTIVYDEDAVKERFGFKPVLLTDYKGLRGDPSDNIIGVSGIGEKSAGILIQKFGTIENIYKTIKKDESLLEKEGVKKRVIEILKTNEEEAMFSKTLATIRADAPIDFSIPEKSWKDGVDISEATTLFTELDFRTLSQRLKDVLSGGSVGPVSGPVADVQTKDGQNTLQSSLSSRFEDVSPEELKKVGLALWVLNSNMTNPTIDEILNFAKTESFTEAKEFVLAEIKNKDKAGVYEKIELSLVPVIKKMEERGIMIDKKYLEKLSVDYHKKLDVLEKNIWREAGEEFNVASPKQLGVVLFEKMGLKIKNQKKTSGGQMSTKESELEKMRELHPIIGYVLEYREFSKLLGTYIDAIPKLLDEKSRLHTTFLQAGTTTGRMSSNNPNIQNIPIKTELGRNIRNAFVADKGFKLISLDYSQIELRVAAFLSGDKKLIEIFKQGGDVHTAVASQVFGVPREKVDKEMRRKAKVINFGIIYGIGVNALKTNLGTSREEAQGFYDNYFKTFDGLAKYLEKIKSDAEKLGYTETFFGRRRYFEDLKSKLPYIRAMAERMAINAPIQGTAADILKIAMTRVEGYIEKEKLNKDAFILLQVHDELVCEVKSGLVEEFAKKAKEIMEQVLPLKDISGVPIVANASAGDNWGEA